MATSVLLFAGLDKNGDNNLWVTDGTAAGTSEISVAGVGSEGLFGLPPATHYFAALPDGRVLFSGIDANGHVNLWVTNGTSAGTSEISISKQFAGGFNPQHLTVFGSKVLFEGLDSQDHGNLWVTNGTAAGTSELSVKGQHPNSFVPQDFTVLGSKVLFNGQDSSNNYDLWVTNGTAAGTSEISVPSTNVSPVIGLDPQDLVTLGSEVLFRGLDHSNLWGLWVTDGTVQGTSELVRHGSSFEPDDLTVFGNKVLFNSFDASDRINLWVTDGTAAGTSLLTVANIDTNEFDEGLSPRRRRSPRSTSPTRPRRFWSPAGPRSRRRRVPARTPISAPSSCRAAGFLRPGELSIIPARSRRRPAATLFSAAPWRMGRRG